MSDLLEIYFASRELQSALDRYEKGSRFIAESNGPLLSALTPNEILEPISNARQALGRMVRELPPERIDDLMRIEDFWLACGRLRGVLFGAGMEPDETARLDAARRTFETNWGQAECLRAFAIVNLYDQPIHVPLQTNIAALSDAALRRYIHFTLRQPHIMVAADEDIYLAYYDQLIDWVIALLEESDGWPQARRSMMIGIIHENLTFGTSYYLDRPIGSIVRGRARLMAALNPRLPDRTPVEAMPKGKPFDPTRKKVRLGVISRNMGDYTDTRALFAQFQSFDPALYDLYWYSYDIVDPTTHSDAAFFRRLFGRLEKAVSLRGTAPQMAGQILADDLDVLVVGSAFSFGVKKYDAYLSHRLARLQFGSNIMVPGSSGFDSYDYYIIPESDPEVLPAFREEASEELVTIPDPLVWYEQREPTPPSDFVTRAALGIPEDAVVYCSGAAANKQMPDTLRCWLDILKQVPNGYLLLYPYNPAWGGYYIGLTFLARLRTLLAEYPEIDPDRIKIVRQVSPADGDRLIGLCDVYLGSFPHGGATSVMLALLHRKPVLARRALWLRSTSDPSFLKCLGMPELIARDNADLVALGVKLGLDKNYRCRMTQLVHERMKAPLFFHADFCSKRFQSLFDQLLARAGHPAFAAQADHE